MKAEPVRIDGLNEFRANLKAMDRELPKGLRLAFNEAAQIVISDARPRVPRRSGRAAGSIRAKSTQTFVRISEGGNRAPYMPWLDFGGQIGNRSGKAHGRRGRRPFLKDGRYIYASYHDKRPQFAQVLEDVLLTLARRAGFEVD